MQLTGSIFKGRQEGAHYVELYQEEIRKLDIEPFYGTLNIRVDPKKRKEFLDHVSPTKISGFSKDGNKYGGLFCYVCKDKDQNSLIVVVPEKTHHNEDVLEIVSTKNLRKEFNLNFGDAFTLFY